MDEQILVNNSPNYSKSSVNVSPMEEVFVNGPQFFPQSNRKGPLEFPALPPVSAALKRNVSCGCVSRNQHGTQPGPGLGKASLQF